MAHATARPRALIFGLLIGLLAIPAQAPARVQARVQAQARAKAKPFRLDLTAARARLKQGWLHVRTPWVGKRSTGPVTLRLLDLHDRVLARASVRTGAGKLPKLLTFRLRVPPVHRCPCRGERLPRDRAAHAA